VRDPVDVVRRLGGHARAQEALLWTTRHKLWLAVHQGRLLKPSRGLYVLPELPSPEAASARARGRLSHASAAKWWGLALVAESDVVHVTVSHGGKPPPQEGVRVHSTTEAIDGTEIATPVLRTVLDCATTMPFPEALAIADSALAERWVRPEQLREAARASRGPGRARRLRVADAADRRADNAFESCLRGIVLGTGMTGFDPQLEIRLPNRTVRVDLGDPERRVAIEADSFAHHGTREALVRDCERYDEIVAEGWKVLRFTWEHVMFEQTWVGEMVAMTCRAQGGRSYITARRHVAV
jgi:very-short-patch-repair endonuclease